MSAAQIQAKQIQKVYSEWCMKAAEIILAARVDSSGVTGSASSSSFSLKVPELFNVRSQAVSRPEFFQLKTQRSFQLEVYIGNPEEDAGVEEAAAGELLERWTFTFLPAHPDPSAQMDRCNQSLVRKLSVSLRSLLCFVRLLPAHGLCRSSRTTSATTPPRHYRFRVEAWPPTSRAASPELVSQDFVSMQSSVGTLRLSVAQRKDLKSVTGTGPLKSAAAVGSQIEKIEVEEGYFAAEAVSASSSAEAERAAPLGRLDKIAEEPEATQATTADEVHKILGEGMRRVAPECSLEGQSLSTAPCSTPYEASSARGDRSRSRLDSEGSVCSTMSTSSRAPSSFNDHAVVLGATPPLAGAACLHPSSTSSSRSHTPPLMTPHSTPQQGPCPDPGVPSASFMAQSAAGSRSGTPGLGTSQQVAGAASTSISEEKPSSPTSVHPGVLEDLSSIWMNNLPDWGRRRSMSLGGASRGTTSRSVSPEDPSRCSASYGGLATRGSACSSITQHRQLAESEGEICMFGMSDDEEDKLGSEDEEARERNVVASAIMEGGGGGAFAFSSGQLDSARLGLAGLDLDSDSLSQPVSASRRTSDVSQASSPRRKMLSPLIANLNPFQNPPSLDLPPAAPLGDLGDEADTPTAGGGASAGAASTGPPAASSEQQPGKEQVELLLEQMGDLVCQLQQRQELSIVREEASPEELLRRLEHFRDVSEGMARQHHGS